MNKKSVLKIKYRKLAELIPYANNSRTHTDEQIKQIASSIQEFGFVNPVLIDDDDGIIAGHGRIKAATLLKTDEVPTVTLSGLTEAQKKAYVLADNQLALNAGWDLDTLKLELENLHELDFDTDVLGFDNDFLDGLMDEPVVGLTDENDVPDPPAKPVSVLGDIWQLGNHIVMAGDSTKAEDVERLMGGEKADMVLADPPYGMDAVKNSGVLKDKYRDVEGDADADVAMALVAMWKASKMVWWGANYYTIALPPSPCWLVWNKNNGDSDQMDAELAWTNLPGVTRMYTQASEKVNRVHPTQKPVSLFAWIIERWGDAVSVIADPSAGSGTTLIAAEQTGRTAFLMELDPLYVDVTVQRWEDYTGEKATIEA